MRKMTKYESYTNGGKDCIKSRPGLIQCPLFANRLVCIRPGIFNYFLSFFILFILCEQKGIAQTTIIAEGFNNTLTAFTFSGTGAFYTGNSGTGDRPASSPFAIEGTHSGGVTNGTLTLTSVADINTSSYSDIQLSLRAAAFSIGSTSSGVDLSDKIIIQISTNSGGSYTTILTVNGCVADAGTNDAWWAYSATGLATTAYPTATSFTPAGSGSRTTDGYSTLTITSLPATTSLRVRIVVNNNATNERYVIDDFKITGCAPPAAPTVTTPITYCQNVAAVALTATGSSLLWYTTPTGGTGSSTAPVPSTSAAGTTPYYVSQTVTCEGPRAQINVGILPAPVSSVVDQTNISCFSASDGSITISASGGTGPYTFSVDNGSGFQAATGTNISLFTGLQPNTPYRVRVKDGNGCISK